MEEDKELSKRERKRLNREKKREEESKSEAQSGMVKKLGFIAIVVVGAVFVWNLLQGGNNTDNPADSSVITDSEVRETDHVKGNPDAEVVLIEYGDFQCSACATYYPIIKQLEEKYSDQLAIAYRHFPLRSIHRNAQISAQAAEAAGRQDKFWEMHDLLFERQTSWADVRDPRSDFISYAEELELDVEKFEADMNSAEVKTIVDNGYNESITLGINSTPTFILNGEKLNLSPNLAAFEAVIDAAIAETGSVESPEESTESAEVETE